MELLTSRDLYLRGHQPRDLTRLVASGQITRLFQGHYMLGEAPNPVARHLLMAGGRHEVWSHETAALAHALPLLGPPPERVQLLEPGTGRSRVHAGRVLHSAPLPASEVVMLGDHQVTSIARTVVDITRTRGLEAGLVPWEAARWRARLDGRLEDFDQQTQQVVQGQRRRHGIGRARLALEQASAWSQSPMETRSLHAIRGLGLPAPQQQYPVLDTDGQLIGFVDFAWPEWGVLGEYDGMEKYAALARPGETPAQVVRREKQRQQRMEYLGWEFARWGGIEVREPHRLRRAVIDARERAHRRALLPNLREFAG